MEDQQNNQEPQWAYTPSGASSQVQQESSAPEAENSPMLEPVTWSASEYIAHDKSGMWSVYLFAGTIVLCSIIYFLTRDWVSVVVIGISVLLLGIYAYRKPRIKQYSLTASGLQIDEQFHPYAKFKSFSLVEEGAIDSIWLKPLKRFSPVVVLYCSPEEEAKIAEMLSNFLPHEQRELDAIDRFSKQMRF